VYRIDLKKYVPSNIFHTTFYHILSLNKKSLFMPGVKTMLYILVISLFVACLPDDESTPRFMGDVVIKEGEIENISIDPGTKNVSLALNNDLVFNLKIHFPDTLMNSPLVLALHWAGNGDEYNVYGECQAIEGLKNTDAIIVIPSSPGGFWWDPQMEILLMDMLDKMLNTWPVDDNKVVITGYSNGATATWLYAKNYPDVFSAAIPVSGFYETGLLFGIPVYAIHGELDELYPLGNVENTIQSSINKGSDIRLIVATDLTHSDGCLFSPFLAEAGQWLLTEVW
jgi:hypothetical protein